MAIRIMDAMDPLTEKSLLSKAVPRKLACRRWLFHEGERTDDAYLIVSGLIKLIKTSSNGSEVLLSIRGTGDIVGELSTMDGEPRLVSAIAMNDSYVIPLSREHLIRVMRDRQDLTLALLANLTTQLRSMAFHTLAVTADDSKALVARRLFQLASEPRFEILRSSQNGSIIVEMPVSQRELATWAGASHRSTVGVLEQLRRDGIINTSRLHLEVLDLPGLQWRAGSLIAPELR